MKEKNNNNIVSDRIAECLPDEVFYTPEVNDIIETVYNKVFEKNPEGIHPELFFSDDFDNLVHSIYNSVISK